MLVFILRQRLQLLLYLCVKGVKLTSEPKLQPKDPSGFQNYTLLPSPAHSEKKDHLYQEPGEGVQLRPFHRLALGHIHTHALPHSGISIF